MGKPMRLPSVIRRESLKKEDAASERESESELEELPASETKGSRNVVCRFMNCWWKASGARTSSLEVGVWMTMHFGSPKGHPNDADGSSCGRPLSLCNWISIVNSPRSYFTTI